MPPPPPPPPAKHDRAWRKRAWLILVALSLCLPALCSAQTIYDTCIHQGPLTVTTNTTVSLSSATPLNQPIGDWITINHTPGYHCTRVSLNPVRRVYLIGSTPSGTTTHSSPFVTVDGQTYRIFIPPGQTNLGYIVRAKHSVVSTIWNATMPNHRAPSMTGRQTLGAITRRSNQGPIPSEYNVSMEVQVRLIKTSTSWPANGDSVNFDALLSESYIGIGVEGGPGSPPLLLSQYIARVNVPSFDVFTPTCSTPSLADSGNTVPLGGVYAASLTGPGSAAPSVPFTLRVNCSAGFEQGVKYRFLACPSCTTPPQNSTLTLDGNATAGGVGVQVLYDDDSTLLSFNSDHTLSDYNNASGGQYNIPLRARIIQTCSTTNCASPGSVRASMIMQMVYP